MALFNFLKSNKTPDLNVSLKTPQSTTTDDIELDAGVKFSSRQPIKVSGYTLRMVADLVDKKQSPSAQQHVSLGEIGSSEEIVVDPKEPYTTVVRLPLDFTRIGAYEIPPENLAAASEAMRAAAQAARSAVYKYVVDIKVKLADAKEIIVANPIQVVDPKTVRSSKF